LWQSPYLCDRHGFALVKNTIMSSSTPDSTAGIDTLIALIDSEDVDADATHATSTAVIDKCGVAPLAALKHKRRLPSNFSAANGGEPPPPPQPLRLPVPTIYTRSEAEADELCSRIESDLSAGALPILGLDIEWRVSFEAARREPCAAVVQLATQSAVYVLHVHHMRRFPEALGRLLEAPGTLKAGCKVGNDAMKLRRDFDVCASGLVELGSPGLAARFMRHGERSWSLKEMCEAILHRTLPKELRMSDWEASWLSPEELQYGTPSSRCAGKARALQTMSSAVVAIISHQLNRACIAAALDAWASRAVAFELLRREVERDRRAVSGLDRALTDAEWLRRILPSELVTHVPDDPMWSRMAAGRRWLERRAE
jgi:hypothetical protein